MGGGVLKAFLFGFEFAFLRGLLRAYFGSFLCDFLYVQGGFAKMSQKGPKMTKNG